MRQLDVGLPQFDQGHSPSTEAPGVVFVDPKVKANSMVKAWPVKANPLLLTIVEKICDPGKCADIDE